MRDAPPPPSSGRYFSLSWKLLIGVSLVLMLVNAALAFHVYGRLVSQFEDDQTRIRDRQAEQLRTLLDDRYQQLARLANLVPLLASEHDAVPFERHLQHALDANGGMLDLEWDIRSVHWVDAAGQIALLWPAQAPEVPAALLKTLRQAPEQTATLLSCATDCRQYLAAPVLLSGRVEGALVLGRLVADALLAFQALTGADVAIAVRAEGAAWRWPAATSPERILPLLAGIELAAPGTGAPVRIIERGGDRFELFRLEDASAAVTPLIVNRVTAQRQSIASIARHSAIIGVLGLLLSEALLLVLMRHPLQRIRKLAHLLPLLAENRFETLERELPPIRARLPFRDEMDLTIEAVGTLNRRMRQLQTEREAAQAELVWLADHDPLTKLPNRRRLYQALGASIAAAQGSGTDGALLFFDLDRFKDVNDISGHSVGDRLLQRIARKLVATVGDRGLLGRLGGDEFALLMPRATAAEALALAGQLQNEIRATSVRVGRQCHQVSASIGIVLFPSQGDRIPMLLANADLAMYQAKARGRGRAHLYSERDEGRAHANARVLWSRRITEALDTDRLELHFQPILAVQSNRIWRAEALLRMRGAEGQLILPGAFIPIAEETGLIKTLDRWVLEQAFKVLSTRPDIALSLNLSANALADRGLCPRVAELLRDTRIDPARITFEITETIAINSVGDAVELMNDIRALGCRFALDDFGSGFASYAYLKQLPVDDIKIDGSFVRDLHRNREDRIFVKAVTEMAHGMNKKVVAEFVESADILALLRELGVDYAQGYHIGRPVAQPPPGAVARGMDPARLER